MGKVLITDSKITAIANAIREKVGSSETYTLDEMPAAITNIQVGEGVGSTEFTSGVHCLRDWSTGDWTGFWMAIETVPYMSFAVSEATGHSNLYIGYTLTSSTASLAEHYIDHKADATITYRNENNTKISSEEVELISDWSSTKSFSGTMALNLPANTAKVVIEIRHKDRGLENNTDSLMMNSKCYTKITNISWEAE